MTALSDDELAKPCAGCLNKKQMVAAVIFALFAAYLATVVPSIEIAWVVTILLLTIFLFVFEVIEVDVAAASVMVLLGLTSLLAPVMGLEQGLVDTHHLFDGFASNAVISIIAVMIIGAGLDKTGLMTRVAGFILKIGGTTEVRIIPIISATVGFISSFMQNVGAAALFLPVVSRISARSGLPMSRLLMPMGFTAILGGTMTMVGSSPLILLNDLILTSNKALPAEQQMETWGLFSVTPIGVALVIVGIAYFVLAGRFVLPKTKSESSTKASDSMSYFHDIYGIDYRVHEIRVPEDSQLIGNTLDDVETIYSVRVIAAKLPKEEPRFGPGSIARDTEVVDGMVLGVVASPVDLDNFVEKFGLQKFQDIRIFNESLSPRKSGIAEVVIPPGSSLIGKSARDVWMRKTYGLALIGLHRNGETMREGEDIRNFPFIAGDTLVVHTPWVALERIEHDKDFVVVTSEYPKEEQLRPEKLKPAVIFFGIGLAVETTGTAKWIAEQVLSVVGHMPIWVIQASVAVLATFFTLVMSNVGATVLLVPLAVNIALGVGADPAVFALTVAIATSNSFLIPTHQVNALIMGPAGYRVPDFMKAGGIMTVLFLVVMLVMMNLVF